MAESTSNSSGAVERRAEIVRSELTSHTSVSPGAGVVDVDDDFAARLQAVRGGCRQTLGALLESLRNYLLMVATESCRSAPCLQQNPSDLVQWAQLEACRDFHQFRGTKRSELQAWVKQILIRNVLDARKSKQRLDAATRPARTGFEALFCDPDDLPADNPSPSSFVARNERDERLHDLMGKLPGRYGQIIALHHFRKLTFVQIAQEWNCTEHAARGTWTRALQRLAKTVRPLL